MRAVRHPPRLDLVLFVNSMGPALGTELLDRKLVGLGLLVFGGGVVALLATFARQRNLISHNRIRSDTDAPPKRRRIGKPTTGFEPVTSSLPRKCSTD